MQPELFGFVKTFGLMLALSFVIGIWLSLRRGRAAGFDPQVILDLCFVIMVSSLVGVRTFFVLTHRELYREWYRFFFIWDGGLTLFGGLLLAMVAVAWYVRRNRLRFLEIADVLAPAVMLGIGITRLGCFLSGCCFGKPTDLPWGVHFPATCLASTTFGGLALHPSQLYASLIAFAAFAFLLLAERRPVPPGTTFGRFLVIYGVARFLLEFTRFIEPSQQIALGLSNNQFLSLGLTLAGAVVLITRRPPTEDVDGDDV